MRPVQFILVLLVMGVTFFYFNRMRSNATDRFVVFIFGAGGVLLAIFPKITNTLADLVGVGRGADLFIYLSLVGFGFFGLLLYTRIRDLENSLTDLARKTTIRDAHTPQIDPPNSEETPE